MILKKEIESMNKELNTLNSDIVELKMIKMELLNDISKLMSHKIDLTSAEMNDRKKASTILSIAQRIHGYPLNKISSKSRKRELIYARNQIIWMMSLFTKMSTTKIGDYVGRDHATVLNSRKVHVNDYETNNSYRATYELFLSSVNEALDL